MKRLLPLRRGQGMVEAIFAIGIMLTVVSVVLALTIANISGGKESEFQITANNLAREGIEAIRSMRDTNWLAGRPWDQGISGADDVNNVARIEFDDAQNAWTLNFNFTTAALYMSPDGLYSHNETIGAQSPYERTIAIEYVCMDADGDERIAFPCGVNEQRIGIKITSRVGWAEHGRQRQVALEDLLYAWK